MNKFFALTLTSIVFLSTVGNVFAHVTLDPKQAAVGRQVYGIRVPNEKDIPTTKLEVIIPEGIEVTGILPIAGWNHIEEKNKDIITKITWSGGKINSGEYMVFNLSTNYTGNPKSMVWKVYQTYSDGDIVAWDDTSDEYPAPKVTILEKLSGASAESQEDAHDDEAIHTAPMDMNTWLSGGAFVLSLISLIISLKGRKIKL
ncbi:hypothetical protein BH09PAT2_BH09PAT2_10810 [soil metagenome]